MRCSGWSSLAISASSALAALALAAPAAAHVGVSPPFLSAGGETTLTLAVPNERDDPMTELAVTVPADARLVRAEPADGWTAAADGATATWSGGRLAAGAVASFELRIEAPATPGPAELRAEQRYPGGEVVRWPVTMTVTPATSVGSSLWRGVIVAIVGLVLAVLVAVLIHQRRRRRSLQER
jgi:uncharacterized protein YcnI